MKLKLSSAVHIQALVSTAEIIPGLWVNFGFCYKLASVKDKQWFNLQLYKASNVGSITQLKVSTVKIHK